MNIANHIKQKAYETLVHIAIHQYIERKKSVGQYTRKFYQVYEG
jgi:hypothetical protein